MLAEIKSENLIGPHEKFRDGCLHIVKCFAI